jgi:hypothetical protein
MHLAPRAHPALHGSAQVSRALSGDRGGIGRVHID